MAEERADDLPATERAAAGNLGWSLGMVLRAWQEEVDEALRGMPGGSRGYHVLSVVAQGEPRRQKDLAGQVALDRTVLVYLIDDLVEAGLVERRPDPTDRRARLIAVTERGVRVLAEAKNRVAMAEERMLAGISPEERLILRKITTKAASAIHDTRPNTDPCVAVRSVLDIPS
ncbi:winged helix DNA-binding protein [Microbispora sp. RL4-1S]|uniref:Winged helix DNA-binding protein n=1 Tax=Microbispora oryzae TaxID=2806554 RepID=A0A940WQ84_9ACTN|nr:winged helix DNA-binding protein [Microbispora oryzae]MBP2705525.1 winged helix DNA-binding protein [Microbispora oryzae]